MDHCYDIPAAIARQRVREAIKNVEGGRARQLALCRLGSKAESEGGRSFTG